MSSFHILMVILIHCGSITQLNASSLQKRDENREIMEVKRDVLEELGLDSIPNITVTLTEQSVLIRRMQACPSECLIELPNAFPLTDSKKLSFQLTSNYMHNSSRRTIIRSFFYLKVNDVEIAADKYPLAVSLQPFQKDDKKVTVQMPRGTTGFFQVDVSSIVTEWGRMPAGPRKLVLAVHGQAGDLLTASDVFEDNKDTRELWWVWMSECWDGGNVWGVVEMDGGVRMVGMYGRG